MQLAVLFMVFNRPALTERSFQAIRAARPARLYLAADGPRHAADAPLCEQVRAIAGQVDWPCEVKTLFHRRNLGCRLACSSAISWFFRQEPEGVVLEDDCLAHRDFFEYSRELLERYRDDPRLMVISGSNFQYGKRRGAASYYFSRFSHIWGWASWARAWQNYDLHLEGLEMFCRGRLQEALNHQAAAAFFMRKFMYVAQGLDDTWDYQLQYSVWKQRGLCIIPNHNLVDNIGQAGGTHGGSQGFDCLRKVSGLYGPDGKGLVHPPKVAVEAEADQFECERRVNENTILWPMLTREAVKRLNEGDSAAMRELTGMIREYYGPLRAVLQLELAAALKQEQPEEAAQAARQLWEHYPEDDLLRRTPEEVLSRAGLDLRSVA